MKKANPLKQAAAKAREEQAKNKDSAPKFTVKVPGTTQSFAVDTSGIDLLAAWIGTKGTYDLPNTKQTISQMLGGQGKRGTLKYNGQPVYHASSGSGSGGSGACTIWFAESGNVYNLLALGHHLESKNAKYEVDWICENHWTGGAVGKKVGGSGVDEYS